MGIYSLWSLGIDASTLNLSPKYTKRKINFLISSYYNIVLSVYLPACLSVIYLFILSLCFPVWHGMCWIWVVNLANGRTSQFMFLKYFIEYQYVKIVKSNLKYRKVTKRNNKSNVGFKENKKKRLD